MNRISERIIKSIYDYETRFNEYLRSGYETNEEFLNDLSCAFDVSDIEMVLNYYKNDLKGSDGTTLTPEQKSALEELITILTVELNFQSLLHYDNKFKYQLLDRMRCDCEYYLNYGERHKKVLWSCDEETQIDNMKRLYNNFSNKEKPNFLSMNKILEYEKLMVTVDM